MLKLNYPKDKSLLEDYLNCLSVKEFKKVTSFLEKIEYKGKYLTFEILIKLDFNSLLPLGPIIKTHIDLLSATEQEEINALFDYDSNQHNIAAFFMEKLRFMSCHYCGINYINAFNDIADYLDGMDFINNAPKNELILVKGIGAKTADKIIAKREQGRLKTIEDFKLSKAVTSRVRRFDLPKTHNHFTLDHILPQSKYKFFSLCFYNLVPSCYSCNSKFKKLLNLKLMKTSSM